MTDTEPLPFVEAVRRSLEIEERGAHVRTALTLTCNLALAPAQLWPLLVDRSELAHWYGQLNGSLSEGGRYRLADGTQGQVLELVEPHKLSLTCEKDGEVDPLQIRLDPEDDGTTSLRLTHTTLIDREDFDRYGPGAAAIHWEIAVMALASRTGGWSTCGDCVPMPTPQWLEGSDGAAHLQAWSVRWAAEALAAGVDEASARRGELATSRACQEDPPAMAGMTPKG
ncbi:SRPBCC domain-containing protein [Brachybacterium epidermidis]|uniref:SRPBCC domain-containing protein n=1 Tax=Brachybacterium epidermidis TaxID=2781983 RepID=UPI00398E521A